MKTLKASTYIAVLVMCLTFTISNVCEFVKETVHWWKTKEITQAFANEEIMDDQYFYLIDISDALDKDKLLEMLEFEKSTLRRCECGNCGGKCEKTSDGENCFCDTCVGMY